MAIARGLQAGCRNYIIPHRMGQKRDFVKKCCYFFSFMLYL